MISTEFVIIFDFPLIFIWQPRCKKEEKVYFGNIEFIFGHCKLLIISFRTTQKTLDIQRLGHTTLISDFMYASICGLLMRHLLHSLIS
jgi:hypothetical protein